MEKESDDAGKFVVPVFFLIIAAVIFWQTNTDLVEKNIASGSMQYNAAFVPEMLATLVSILAVFQFYQLWKTPNMSSTDDETIGAPPESHLVARSLISLVIIAVYIMTLRFLGYHIATPLMLGSLLMILNVRNPFLVVAISVGISFASAFVFGRFLNVVLPAGIFEISPF